MVVSNQNSTSLQHWRFMSTQQWVFMDVWFRIPTSRCSVLTSSRLNGEWTLSVIIVVFTYLIHVCSRHYLSVPLFCVSCLVVPSGSGVIPVCTLCFWVLDFIADLSVFEACLLLLVPFASFLPTRRANLLNQLLLVRFTDFASHASVCCGRPCFLQQMHWKWKSGIPTRNYRPPFRSGLQR